MHIDSLLTSAVKKRQKHVLIVLSSTPSLLRTQLRLVVKMLSAESVPSQSFLMSVRGLVVLLVWKTSVACCKRLTAYSVRLLSVIKSQLLWRRQILSSTFLIPPFLRWFLRYIAALITGCWEKTLVVCRLSAHHFSVQVAGLAPTATVTLMLPLWFLVKLPRSTVYTYCRHWLGLPRKSVEA